MSKLSSVDVSTKGKRIELYLIFGTLFQAVEFEKGDSKAEVVNKLHKLAENIAHDDLIKDDEGKRNSDPEHWKFEESQRDEVCRGKLCPSCLGTNIECTGCVPDGMNVNYGYKCKECKESWEGY